MKRHADPMQTRVLSAISRISGISAGQRTALGDLARDVDRTRRLIRLAARKADKPTVWSYLTSLPNVGLQTAELLCKRYGFRVREPFDLESFRLRGRLRELGAEVKRLRDALSSEERQERDRRRAGALKAIAKATKEAHANRARVALEHIVKLTGDVTLTDDVVPMKMITSIRSLAVAGLDVPT